MLSSYNPYTQTVELLNDSDKILDMAKELRGDCEGGLNNDDAKAKLNAMVNELSIGGHGQHATTIEARSAML